VRPQTRWGLNGGRGTATELGWSHAQGERGGERVRLRAQVSGGKWASGVRGSKGARMCGGGQRTSGRGHVHDEGRGREVGDGLRGGVRGTKRAGACARGTVPTSLAHWTAGGREGRERAGETGRQVRPDCQRGRACGRACELGRLGLTGPHWLFLFPRNF
jgi:hypothetical protein